MDSYFSFALLSLFLFIFMLFKVSTRSKTNLPPGPTKFPFIGNLHLFVLDSSRLPHQILRDLSIRYGPVMHLQLGGIPTVIISSPQAAKEVMKTNDLSFANRPKLLAIEISFYGGTNIGFVPYGTYWRQTKKIATLELLSRKRVQSFQRIRTEEFMKLCRRIASNAGSPTYLSELFISTSYDTISRTTIGKMALEQETFVPVLKEIMDVLGGFHVADLYPSIKILGNITGLKYRIQRLHKEIDRILEQAIQAKQTAKKKNNIDSEVARKEKREEDVLDVLLKLMDDNDLELPLNKNNVKAIILDFFVAGSETSPTTVDWAMSEILKNPDVLNKAQYEVRQVFDRSGGYVDESHLDQLKYLKLVIKETLRMHPPAVLLVPRESRERSEIIGYEIPAKTRVMINAWAINRDPNYWEDPECFIPERFLNLNIDYNGTDFQYIPFGAGRRMCPGISYGLINVETMLALLLYHFDWSVPGGMKPEEIDMTEMFGLSVRRKNELCLIPTVARSLPTEY